MDVQQYLELQNKNSNESLKFRELCIDCFQSKSACYCSYIKKFDAHIDFIILIHPSEIRRRIATGRMSHLILENSQLIEGDDYSNNKVVNDLIEDLNRSCVILYPGKNANNITLMTELERGQLFPSGKKLTVFVIDGTWKKARQMLRLSKNLNLLPQICFSSNTPSAFLVRKQPSVECYSTIEAIYHIIELVGQSQGFEIANRVHDNLIHVFSKMVANQLKFIKISEQKPGALKFRRHIENI